jgi:AraC-like DNA-binding protein
MDPLSHILTSVRVNSSDCVRLEFGGNWGFRFDGYEHAHFGVLSEGSCWLSTLDAARPIALRTGDCWLLPRGETHVLRSRPRARIRPYDEVRSLKKNGHLRYAVSEGPVTTIIVGNFTLDRHAGKWLTDLLPSLIAFRMDQENPSTSMQAILQILARECQDRNMGSTLITSRLADILFVQAVRAYVDESRDDAAGWLRALADERLSAALGIAHGAVEKRWTVASLAAVAGISRSGFASRFKDVLGETPIDYLTRLRMYKAAQFLRENDTKLAKVASLVGYESEAAFSKAFKKAIGMAPGRYKNGFRGTLVGANTA